MTTGAKPLRLKGATPTGGTYSGTGVSMGFFYPTVAGSGTHLISYNYIEHVHLCRQHKPEHHGC